MLDKFWDASPTRTNEFFSQEIIHYAVAEKHYIFLRGFSDQLSHCFSDSHLYAIYVIRVFRAASETNK